MSDEIDLTEFLGEDEISENHDDENENTNFLKEFSPKQIGSISKYIEPISGFISMDAVSHMFKENTAIDAYPVEENDHVIGIIDRRTVETETNTAIKRFFSKTVAETLVNTNVVLQAKEYIELNLEKLTELNKKTGMEYYPVFDNRTFVGIVSFHDFLEHIAEIRNQDLEKAAAIQKSFLANNENLKSFRFSITCWNRMANQLGGDFFHAFQMNDRETFAFSCDVSGKNVAASLLTIAAASFFEARKSIKDLPSDPQSIIGDFDEYLSNVVPVGNFITGAFVYIDTKRKIFQVFNCGHTNVYLVYSGEGQSPKIGAVIPKLPPLGLGDIKKELKKSKDVTNPKEKPYLTMSAKRGIHIELYSDGFTDMMNDEGFRYEDENAKKFFLNLYRTPASEVYDKIESTVNSFTGKALLPDDITVIDIRLDSPLFF